MKPILLKLSGLQSYREPQVIDFTELCEGGLFGIFGPTGSGKSTLLDAITLALYGKVERAPGGTQGIMNHAEDTLFVAYTFELMAADKIERYRVERRFKRTGENTVSNSISRFIAVKPEGDEVVADKLAEVTRCVEDKLGLKMDDFTRAVVLPQGKFAEFLSLKGSERRQMLQRLFHLERYGDQLGQKLSRRVKETDSRLKELTAEQQGLGNASSEALQEATERLKLAASSATARRRELLAAQQTADELGKVHELVLEQRRLTAAEAALRERDNAIAADEARLRQASAAEALAPALSAWKTAVKASSERQHEAGQASATAAARQAEAGLAAAASEAAWARLTAEEPELLRRLSQLEQAQLLQGELASLEREQAELISQHASGRERRQALADELGREQQLLAKAEQRRQELEEQLKSCEVKSAWRHKLQEALRLQEALAVSKQQYDALAREEREQQEHLTKALLALDEVTRLESETAKRQELLAGKASERYERIRSTEDAILLLSEQLEQYEGKLRSKLNHGELSLWSVKLAEGLSPGCACPVCGSLDHPSPAQHVGEEEGNIQQELSFIGTLLPELREQRFEAARTMDGYCNLLEHLEMKEADKRSSVHSEAASTVEVEALDRTSEAASLASLNLEEFNKAAAQLRAELKECKAQLETLQHRARQMRDERTRMQHQAVTVTAEVSSARKQALQSSDKLQAADKQLQAIQVQWAKDYPDLTPEELQIRCDEIAAKDAQTEDIRSRLEKSVPFIKEKNSKLSTLQESLAQLDQSLVEWVTRLDGGDKLLKEKSERLTALTGGQPADQLWEEATTSLNQLREKAKFAQEQQRITEERWHEASKLDVLARQAAETAAEQAEKLTLQWQELLHDSPFTEESEVEGSLLEPKEMEVMTKRVQEHREAERDISSHLRDINTRLAGRTVTEEMWSASQHQLEICKQADEEALRLKARAERDLEDIEQRHVRWKELEDTRKGLEHQSGLLAKLQSSLRGNAFVEFVAEEQLTSVSRAASQRLRFLTKQRYALEVDSAGGFVISDDSNGGVKRPVSTLSGGETFLTSLALALALSAQIQLRGQYPLQFFFLDEGFGTLDPELLDTVITSLEHLHHDHLSVGVISHVAELRARLPRKLVVIPADSLGQGSRVVLEQL